MGTPQPSPERATLAAMIELASADKRDWNASIQQILRVQARVLEVERVSFWELRNALVGGERVLVCEMAYHQSLGAFERGPMFSLSERSDYLEALVNLGRLEVEDVRVDPRSRSARAYLDAHRIGSLLDCPVWCGGNLAGVLSLEHVGQPRRWSVSDVCFALAAAQTASTALEARERTQAQECSKRMAFLERAARSLGQTLDAEEVARRAVALIIPSLADGARVGLFEDDAVRTAVLEYRTAEGRALLDAALREPADEQSFGEFARRLAANRNSILVPDATQQAFVDTVRDSYPKLPPAFRAIGLQSLLWVPLFVHEPIIGFLMLYSATRRFGLGDLERAEELAKHVSAALANAQLHRRVQAALQTREEFIALAGHELRTPLTALGLTAQELLRRAPNDVMARPARTIVKQVKRLERLSSQMLDAAHIASGVRFPCCPASTDLALVAREAADVLAPLCEQSGCTLLVKADEPVMGKWDATQLDAMLSCLLDNAVKFGGGKPVEITVRREDDAATLSVRDHGQGIPPDRVGCIFERFERAVSASHYGGLGLGLFIARGIAAAHGGKLTVDNRPGEGVTFTARLPLEPPTRAAPVTNAESLPYV